MTAPATPAVDPFARYTAAAATTATTAPAAPMVPPVGGDLFDAPAPTADKQPRIPDLNGRLVLIRPIKVDEVPKAGKFGGKPGETTQRLTADIVVLDGGTLLYGGQPEDPDEPTPHDRQTEVPYLIRRRFISQAAIVAKGQAVLDDPKRARWILGRVYKGAKQGDRRAPWLLSVELTDAERQLARAWFAANPQDPFTS